MAGYFCDSSSIAKRYIVENGTNWIINLTRKSAQNDFAISQVTGVEVVSALTRRHRGNFLTTPQYDKAVRRFLRDFNNRFGIVKINDTIIRNAIRLSQTYALRGYDAIQLASALEFDAQLLKLGIRPIHIFICRQRSQPRRPSRRFDD